jgi:hypothetical protein
MKLQRCHRVALKFDLLAAALDPHISKICLLLFDFDPKRAHFLISYHCCIVYAASFAMKRLKMAPRNSPGRSVIFEGAKTLVNLLEWSCNLNYLMLG